MGLFHWFFRFCARRAFSQVDRDNNGRLDHVEVELAVLHLYNVINKRLPGWQEPPSSKQIKTSMEVFSGGAAHLDCEQFILFAHDLVKSGPDVFFARVGRQAVLRTGILPGFTWGLKKIAGEVGGLNRVPAVVLAPAIGTVVGAIRGLLPV